MIRFIKQWLKNRQEKREMKRINRIFENFNEKTIEMCEKLGNDITRIFKIASITIEDFLKNQLKIKEEIENEEKAKKERIIIKFDGGKIVIDNYSKIKSFEINRKPTDIYDGNKPIPIGTFLSPDHIFIRTEKDITISLEKIKE